MSDTSTRSGMLWEVERILTECKELGTLPQILLMENVIQVHSSATDNSKGNVEDFNKWQLRLEELGYKNYWQDLIATDYGIPQTRNRCFMVSILGDYSYSFPPKQELKLKLKDMLEDNVDEKYYLSDAMIKYLTDSVSSGGIDRSESFNRIQEKIERDGIAATITTNAGNRATDNFIKVKNATAKGYLEATDGDGIDLLQPNSETRRGRVQKEAIQTLDTMGGNGKGVVVLGNYNPSNHEASRIIDNNYSAPTIKENHGTINATQTSDLRIRKLTPKECFRLQGVKDEDYEKCAKNQSNASLYHLAGDSIVVNVLEALIKELI